jgi:RimJ/RimL family protein N-acetyltransferase
VSWLAQPLATERLLLRPWSDADRESLGHLLTDSTVRKFLGGAVSDEALGARLNAQAASPWGSFCVTRAAAPDVIGWCELDRARGELEISFAFHPASWGQGLAYEAMGAVIAWVWKSTDVESLIAVTQQANAPSRRLLTRLGFVPETTFEEFDAPQVLYRLPARSVGPDGIEPSTEGL